MAEVQLLPEALKVSRELALLGKYDNSLVHFDGVIATIQQWERLTEDSMTISHVYRYLRTVRDQQERSRWEKLKESINMEVKLVKECAMEVTFLKVKINFLTLDHSDHFSLIIALTFLGQTWQLCRRVEPSHFFITSQNKSLGRWRQWSWCLVPSHSPHLWWWPPTPQEKSCTEANS